MKNTDGFWALVRLNYEELSYIEFVLKEFLESRDCADFPELHYAVSAHDRVVDAMDFLYYRIKEEKLVEEKRKQASFLRSAGVSPFGGLPWRLHE